MYICDSEMVQCCQYLCVSIPDAERIEKLGIFKSSIGIAVTQRPGLLVSMDFSDKAIKTLVKTLLTLRTDACVIFN